MVRFLRHHLFCVNNYLKTSRCIQKMHFYTSIINAIARIFNGGSSTPAEPNTITPPQPIVTSCTIQPEPLLDMRPELESELESELEPELDSTPVSSTTVPECCHVFDTSCRSDYTHGLTNCSTKC